MYCVSENIDVKLTISFYYKHLNYTWSTLVPKRIEIILKLKYYVRDVVMP